MFGNLLYGVRKSDKDKTHFGLWALCWSIWITRNDMIFNKQNGTKILQVIRRTSHWIQLWVFLLPEDLREDMVFGCNRMFGVAQDFFFQATGWWHINTLANE
jgi:hypothetical protein